jgi:hypothetical protein
MRFLDELDWLDEDGEIDCPFMLAYSVGVVNGKRVPQAGLSVKVEAG